MTSVPPVPDTSPSAGSNAGAPAGLLLAAGGGSRLGQPKALVDFHGEPLVVRGIRLLVRGGCRRVVVVVGASAEDVRATIAACAAGASERSTDDVPVEVVENAGWRAGMGTSLRRGIDVLREQHGRESGVVVALVDQPLVGPAAVRRVIAAHRRGAVVAIADYDGRRGHPVLLASSVWDAVVDSARGDVGARALLRVRPEWVEPVACGDVGVVDDVDTAADLSTLRSWTDPNPAGAHAPRAGSQVTKL